jgi:hypothetical protein
MPLSTPRIRTCSACGFTIFRRGRWPPMAAPAVVSADAYVLGDTARGLPSSYPTVAARGDTLRGE